MGFPVNLTEPAERNVGIDLRCCQAAVAEHFTDAFQIGPAVEQMSGETVSKDMWISLFLLRYRSQILSGDPLDKHGINLFAFFRYKHMR